ncbi:MAG: aldehyde ferredoxin oxidoreductase N-terminal domain-containing protein [Thermodesulfobacteriota bacterium]
MIKGWTGKRLRVDLSMKKAWSEDISPADLRQWFGGRGLNASFFSQHFQTPISPSRPDHPVAFAVGPLTGTLAPCSGWTSIASFSPLTESFDYDFTRMPGHFGASLKWAGFDQCVIQGKAERPVYLLIEDGEVKFEKADHLWGKETTETTVALQEEKADRSIEVLCIGPAGERPIPFANVIHRLSWTGDRLGLGYLFGVKQLKAIAIRGKKPVLLQDPGQFLNLCLTLKDQIDRGQRIRRPKGEEALSLLGREERQDPRDGNSWLPTQSEKQWATSLWSHLSGFEGCFSCPVHCSRNVQHREKCLAGIHLEKPWFLGPHIGVYSGEWTLRLHHFCQTQGLDPFLTASLLGRVMAGVDTGPLSEEDLAQVGNIEDPGEKAFTLLRRMIHGGEKAFQLAAPPASENEDLDVLADIVSFCMIVVNRLNLMTVSNIIDLIHGATGYALTIKDLQETVSDIRQAESRLQNKKLHWSDQSTLLHLGKGRISQILRKEERHDVSISTVS